MSGLARYFAHLGCIVCGYDKTSTDLTNDLHNEVFPGSTAGNTVGQLLEPIAVLGPLYPVIQICKLPCPQRSPISLINTHLLQITQLTRTLTFIHHGFTSRWCLRLSRLLRRAGVTTNPITRFSRPHPAIWESQTLKQEVCLRCRSHSILRTLRSKSVSQPHLLSFGLLTNPPCRQNSVPSLQHLSFVDSNTGSPRSRCTSTKESS